MSCPNCGSASHICCTKQKDVDRMTVLVESGMSLPEAGMRTALESHIRAAVVYDTSDGELTKAYYADLERCGLSGKIAVYLFRAQKCSARAKVYRGGIRGRGSFRSMAYERKNWSLRELAAVLTRHAGEIGIRFGWKRDLRTLGYSWVLYVDLPTGQVSFHSAERYDGPDYDGDWDGKRLSADRIIAFCDQIYEVQS